MRFDPVECGIRIRTLREEQGPPQKLRTSPKLADLEN